VRVFGRDAAEIVPHAGDDTRDLGPRKLGKGSADVAPGVFGDAQKGANAARQRAAKGGSAIERQKLEPAEQSRRSPGLQTIGEQRCPSGKVGRGRPCARDQLRNSGGNSFSAPQAEQVAVSTATRCLGPIPDATTKPQLPQR
jgi:hypothetical protein